MDTDALCLHECEIIGEGGTFWPSPTFMVTARDREEEPIVAKSCTGCWSQVGAGSHGVRVLRALPLPADAVLRYTQSRASCLLHSSPLPYGFPVAHSGCSGWVRVYVRSPNSGMLPACMSAHLPACLQILKRINATITQRIAAGENLPPPPRTAIAGPEYFGLNDLSTIVRASNNTSSRLAHGCTALPAIGARGTGPSTQARWHSSYPAMVAVCTIH